MISATTPPAPRLTVLIVEDDVRLAFSMRQGVEHEGWAALTAPTAEKARDVLAAHPVDAAVVDLRLPGGSGLELIEAVASWCGAPALIGISGEASVEAAVRSLRGGATDFLQKPFGAAELVAAISRAFERQRLASAVQVHERAAELLDAPTISDLARRVVSLGMRLIPSEQVSLLLPPTGKKFVLVTARGGEVREEVAEMRPDSVGARVMARGEPALIQGPASADPRFQGLPSSERVHSGIVVPLRGQSGCHGLLSLSRGASERPFATGDLHRAGILAAQTVVAFQQLRSREQVATLERLATLGELMASVAHELNNPISFVTSNVAFALELLHELTPDSAAEKLTELRDALEDAQIGAGRVVALVADMKGLSRADEGCIDVFDVREPIRAACRLAGAELTAVRLELEVPEGLAVRGSSGRLSQVFVNLLVNAAHATEAVEPARRAVRVRAVAAGPQVAVSVEDSGPGVRAELAARIFEPFFSTKPGKGTGLGLPISRDIVRKFGGELELDEAFTGGARFIVRLPRA